MPLIITIPASDDTWDYKKEEFISGTKETKLTLEHSLYAISKWESIYEKPFIGDGSENFEKTPEEYLEYFKCMTVYPRNIPDKVYTSLTQENVKEIVDYIDAKRTATVISHIGNQSANKKEIITSEVVYSWMTILNIPWECDKWFFNRLMILIEVTSIKNDPNPKKMSAKENVAWRKAMNAQRRAKSKK